MTDKVDEFIEDFLQHMSDSDRVYDPVKAHEYYLRTRKLKGRKPGSSASTPVLKTKKKPFFEDQAPSKSPGGAALLSFSKSKGAIYRDGSVYDGTKWTKLKSGKELNRARSIQNIKKKLFRARGRLDKIKDPKKRARLEAKIKNVQARLDAIESGNAPIRGNEFSATRLK